MTLAPVESLLRTRIGLDPASLGPSALARVVERRMRDRDVSTRAAYAGLLTADAVEWSALVAGLAVTETWFFRGGRPLFDLLAAGLGERPAPRVLVVPCSTGEEAYSLAIALADKGVRDCHIDAVDLLESNVTRAALGRYPVFSFREAGADPRKRFFQPHAGQWELRPEFRGRVRFRAANAVTPLFLAGEPAYDLILCRNLFIYLTPAARRQVVANLDRLLSATGRLCLTAAEADQLPAGRFHPDGPPAFVVYRRRGGRHENRTVGRVEEAADEPRRTATATPEIQTPVADTREAPARYGGACGEPPLRPALHADPLTAARALADAGDLDAALAACERAIRRHRGSADAFALQGVIHLAANRADPAAKAIRKALYLDPNHAEALTHMVALSELRGDTAQAAVFRLRLARGASGGAE